MPTPTFSLGNNIAIKVPAHQFEETVLFYTETLGLPQLEATADSVVIDFSGNKLWVDRVDTLSQAEIWLEISCTDVDAATAHFSRHGVVRCDQIETLPDGFAGFWITNSAGIIHLVSKT